MLDVHVLLDPLKEQFDCPPGSVDIADFRCGEIKSVGDQAQLTAFAVRNDDDPEKVFRTVRRASNECHRIRNGITSLRKWEVFDWVDDGIPFQATDKKASVIGELIKLSIIHVTPVKNIHGFLIDDEDFQLIAVGFLGIRDDFLVGIMRSLFIENDA